MPETILVTGATGTVGSRTVKALLKSGGGSRIVAAGRNTAKLAALQSAGAHIAEMDWNKPGTVEQAFSGATKLFLLTSPNFSDSTLEMSTAISAAEAAGIEYIARLSVMGAEDEPGITLTRVHRSEELAIMGSQIDYTFLRPNGFMQNIEQQAQMIKEQNAFYMPLGDARVSFVDVDDIAAVAAAVLLDGSKQYSGKAYDLTGPEAVSGVDMANVLSQVLGREIRYVAVSDEMASGGMRAQGMPDTAIAALMELFESYKQGKYAPTVTAVPSITGRAATSFQQYVANNRAIYS